MTVSIDLTDIIKQLEAMERALRPSEVDKFLMRQCAPLLRKDFDLQFAIAGDPRWKPLSPSTIKQKNKVGHPRLNRFGAPPQALMQFGSLGGSNILIRTGDLRVSWTREDAFFHVCRTSDGTLTIGSKDPIAKYHQSELPRRLSRLTGQPKLPRRAISLRQDVVDNIGALFIQYILSGGDIK